MQKKAGKIAAGMGIGMAVGGAAAMIGNAMMHQSAMKPMKKKASRALQNMEDMLSSVQSMLK